MRNDLIVFEFQNEGEREVLVHPELVAQLADTLAQAFDHAQRVISQEQGTDYFPIQVWLAATERGSLKVAYRALFHPNSTKDFKEAMEATNLALDAMFKIIKIFAGAALLIGAVNIWPDHRGGAEREQELPREQAEEFRHYTDQLLSIGYGSGADRVLITMPDQPLMILALNPELHVSALGSAAIPIDQSLLNREVEGMLEPGSKQLTVRIMGQQEATLTAGRLRVADGPPFPVLFRWNSVRPMPTSAVLVRGRLSNVQSAGIQPFNPVTDDLRSVGIFLDVYKQVVAE